MTVLPAESPVGNEIFMVRAFTFNCRELVFCVGSVAAMDETVAPYAMIIAIQGCVEGREYLLSC